MTETLFAGGQHECLQTDVELSNRVVIETGSKPVVLCAHPALNNISLDLESCL